jgi:hypothetical protein
MSQKLGIKIQQTRNVGENVIGPHKVDGYYEKDGRKVVLEFHGDVWHGNPECYSADTYTVKKSSLTQVKYYTRLKVEMISE